MPSHYDVLGVARGASPAAIRAAYRELAKVEHPDVKPSADASRMVQINLAYRVLSDPTSRAAYDRTLEGSASEKEVLGARAAPAAVSGANGSQTPRESQEANTRAGARAAPAAVSDAKGVDDCRGGAGAGGASGARRRTFLRWVSGVAYAAMVVATIIGARRLAAPSGADTSITTPAPQPPSPQPALLPRHPRDACPPIACPAGATEHEERAGGACKRWCSDAHGATLASASTRVLDEPPIEPFDPQQLSRQRLTCRSQPGRAPTCSLGGGDIELGALPAAAVSSWQVVKAEGAAPAAAGARCELQVSPVPAAIGGDIPYNCRLSLRCGALIYGGGSAGFGLCDVVSGVLRGAIDPLAAAHDGDAAMVLDNLKGRLVVADATWRLSLTPLMSPPKSSSSE
jgi:hypothetical protein